eukprot:6210801-Pleurochrysis_carterae.AAC.2
MVQRGNVTGAPHKFARARSRCQPACPLEVFSSRPPSPEQQSDVRLGYGLAHLTNWRLTRVRGHVGRGSCRATWQKRP